MGRISQLTNASELELTDNTVLIVNTPSGVTKKTTWGSLNAYAAVGFKKAVIRLTNTEVKALNSSPIDVAAAASGVLYRAESVIIVCEHNGVTYATNTTMQIGNQSADVPQMRLLNAINYTTDVVKQFGAYIPAVDENQFVVGEALQLSIASGDPTLDGGNITAYVVYQEIRP